MKRGEGMQPISPAPEERNFDEFYQDQDQVNPETLYRYHSAISDTTAQAAELEAMYAAPSIPYFSSWDKLGRAGLGAVMDVQKKAAAVVLRINTTGM